MCRPALLNTNLTNPEQSKPCSGDWPNSGCPETYFSEGLSINSVAMPTIASRYVSAIVLRY